MDFEPIPFRSDWYDRACELRNQFLRKPLGLDLYEENLAAESAYRHYAMLEEGRVVAYVQAVPLSPHEAKIRQMVVTLSYQRQGVGTKLMQHLELDLKRQGIESLELDARSEAIDFYRNLGYTTVGEEFESVSIPHMKMVKSLIQV